MKLYRIAVEYDVVVAAEDEDAAAQVGLDNYERALRDMAGWPDITVHDIATLQDLPKDWHGCYPYREDGETDTTCDEMLRSPQPAPEKS